MSQQLTLLYGLHCCLDFKTVLPGCKASLSAGFAVLHDVAAHFMFKQSLSYSSFIDFRSGDGLEEASTPSAAVHEGLQARSGQPTSVPSKTRNWSKYEIGPDDRQPEALARAEAMRTGNGASLSQSKAQA